MRGALECQEGVNRRNGGWVGSPHPDLGSPRSIARLIGDLAPPSRHDRGARDYLSMHLEGSREVSGSKGGGDVAHVASDRGDRRCVRGPIRVEDDAPTILKVLKDVGRGVLVDAHDHVTACLHGSEGSVGLARARVPPAPARGECEHKGNRRHPFRVRWDHGWLVGAQRWADESLERRVVSRADAVVGVTKPIADDLRERLGVRTELITNGFDPEDNVTADADGLLDPARHSFVHTGRIAAARSAARPLVDALRRLRDDDPDLAERVEVVLAGPLSAEERRLLGEPDLNGLVRAVGSLDRPRALALQRAADTLLVVTEGARRRSVATGKLFEYRTRSLLSFRGPG